MLVSRNCGLGKMQNEDLIYKIPVNKIYSFLNSYTLKEKGLMGISPLVSGSSCTYTLQKYTLQWILLLKKFWTHHFTLINSLLILKFVHLNSCIHRKFKRKITYLILPTYMSCLLIGTNIRSVFELNKVTEAPKQEI